ncbi:MAG: hypothetical protein KJO33_14210 [Gammaproteobacteria bacterium]|nr:hypothetical protein [Gammaproteobacteria bacterium]
MIHTMRRTALILLVGLFWLIPAQAQDAETEGIARVAVITAKDGHDDALIQAITEYHKWVANFEGHHRYNWYEILTGPNTGKYVARTANHNWADFDAEYDWQEEAGEVFERNVAPHIEHVEMHFVSEMKEFSHWPESFDGYTHYSVSDWYVKNGHGYKFRSGLDRIVKALKAGGFPNHWGFMSIESGGHGNQIRVVGANKGWADMSDPDPSFSAIMTKELGGEEEFQAFMSDWSSTFKPGPNWMVKHMPGASDYGD